MISLLVVNYRSAALAAGAVRSARAATPDPLQVVTVDNSVDASEAAALRAFSDIVVVSDVNRGYAGGINLGRRSCQGETIVVSNPDVTFGEAAIESLAAEVRNGAAVAGPALFWDEAHTWFLPPGDRHTAAERLDEVLAGRSRIWQAQRDRRRFRRRLDFWSLRRTTDVRMLSGAVMAIRASDFDELGGFDERFPLYFEETDFLRRATAHGKRVAYVPQARCRHMYNQSAGQVADHASASYARSERLFQEKWSPITGTLLGRLQRPLVALEARPGPVPDEEVITEASPSPAFTTAAGHFGETTLPGEIRATLRTPFYLRTVARATGRVLSTVKISP